MPQGNKRNNLPTIYRQAHSQTCQNEVEKCNHGIDWQEEGLLFRPANVDHREFENLQNIRPNLKLHKKNCMDIFRMELIAGGQAKIKKN